MATKRPERGDDAVGPKAKAKAKPKPKGAAGSRAQALATPEGAVFGPHFFQAVLRGMVKACPCGQAQEPACVVWLADGQTLDVLEVVALAERYVVLAVYEGSGEDGVQRSPDDVGLEAVPYDLILRVSVRRVPARARLGFHLPREELQATVTAVEAEPPGVNGQPGLPLRDKATAAREAAGA